MRGEQARPRVRSRVIFNSAGVYCRLFVSLYLARRFRKFSRWPFFRLSKRDPHSRRRIYPAGWAAGPPRSGIRRPMRRPRGREHRCSRRHLRCGAGTRARGATVAQPASTLAGGAQDDARRVGEWSPGGTVHRAERCPRAPNGRGQISRFASAGPRLVGPQGRADGSKRCTFGVGGFDPFRAGANALNVPPGEYGRKIKTQRN